MRPSSRAADRPHRRRPRRFPPPSALALLETEGYEVVGEAADGGSALAEAARLQPRIVLLDVHLPDVDGFAVAAELAEWRDPPAVVLTSSRDAGSYRRRLRSSPARGFVPKSETQPP